jgi:hypothetical protein
VRFRKDQLRARVKGDLEIEFSGEAISAHGGLEVFGRYLRSLELGKRLRQALKPQGMDTDYGIAAMVFAVLALIVIGGYRVSHVAFLGVDPVVLRFCGLQRLPSDRTLVRWLKRFSDTALLALETLIRELVYEQIARLKLLALTLDLDGTVLRTGAGVEGAARGFNPHHPKDCSYYPLTVHLSELGQILRIWNRPGNVNDSHGAVGILRSELRDLRTRFGRTRRIRLRMDGAFFLPDMLRFVDEEADVGWAIKVPLWQWLGIREQIAQCSLWTRVDARIAGFTTAVCFGRERWPAAVRVVVYRKRVARAARKHFQLDLLDPADGAYEYSAVATNLDLDVRNLWHFMAGRGGHEKTLAELKSECALDTIPTNHYHANSAWQMLCVLALNLVRSFQIETGASKRRRSRKSTFAYLLQSLRTVRFELIHHPARILRPNGRLRLRISTAPVARHRIQRAIRQLPRAA